MRLRKLQSRKQEVTRTYSFVTYSSPTEFSSKSLSQPTSGDKKNQELKEENANRGTTEKTSSYWKTSRKKIGENLKRESPSPGAGRFVIGYLKIHRKQVGYQKSVQTHLLLRSLVYTEYLWARI